MFFRGRRKSSKRGPRPTEPVGEVPWVPAIERLSPPGLADLEATLDHPDLEPVFCELAEMSIDGAGLDLPVAYDPVLPRGALAELTIFCPEGEWSVTVPSRVVDKRPAKDGSHMRYDIDFINPGELYACIDESMNRFFNRRRGARVRPDESTPLTVQLSKSGLKADARLEDVSVTGIGISVEHGCVDELETGTEVEFSFQLPYQSGALAGMGIVRRFEQLGDEDHLGIEFDTDRSPELVKRHAVIEAFVAERVAVMQDVRDRMKSA